MRTAFQILVVLVTFAWLPLALAQVLKWRRRGRPEQLAILFSMVIFAFLSAAPLWAPLVREPPVQEQIVFVVWLSTAVSNGIFYAAFLRGRRREPPET